METNKNAPGKGAISRGEFLPSFEQKTNFNSEWNPETIKTFSKLNRIRYTFHISKPSMN